MAGARLADDFFAADFFPADFLATVLLAEVFFAEAFLTAPLRVAFFATTLRADFFAGFLAASVLRPLAFSSDLVSSSSRRAISSLAFLMFCGTC